MRLARAPVPGLRATELGAALMPRTIIALIAILLLTATTRPGTAQDAATVGSPTQPLECVGNGSCVEYGGGRERSLTTHEGARASRVAWTKELSVTDHSWRLWPSLTDF